MYYCFKDLTDGKVFLIVYGVFAFHFAGVMVKLMLVLAPVASVLGAVAISDFLVVQLREFEQANPHTVANTSKKLPKPLPAAREIAAMMTIGVCVMLFLYVKHCLWVTATAYSSSSVVLSTTGPSGSKVMFDDFREAYLWLRENTPEDAKVLSWWDYGYQVAAMANRSVIVDSNTWNNTCVTACVQCALCGCLTWWCDFASATLRPLALRWFRRKRTRTT
eukprot:SAG31_NODE_4083_length_3604_cov_3.076462_1_plen_220_part_00